MQLNYKGPIIDCHIHSMSIDSMLKFIKDLNDFRQYKAINDLCYTEGTDDYLPQTILKMLFKALVPGKVYAFGPLHYPEKVPVAKLDFLSQIERNMEMGYDGIKLLEGKTTVRAHLGIPLDSAVYDGFFGYAQENSIPILFHIADPETFWDLGRIPSWAKEAGWFYGDGKHPTKGQLYFEVERILKRYPGLKIIFAHFYFLSDDLEMAAEFLERWPKVCFDITPGSEMYENFAKRTGEWRDFFIRYQDRIFFGTDSEKGIDEFITTPVRTFLETDEKFIFLQDRVKHLGVIGEGIRLDTSILEKIYYINFETLAGKIPKKVNIDAVYREAEWIQDILKDSPKEFMCKKDLNMYLDMLKGLYGENSVIIMNIKK